MTERIQPIATKTKLRLVKLGRLMGGFAIVLSIALVTLLVMKAQPTQQINTDKYQVVYLANGQAYFGKLQNTDGDFLVMKTPYTAQSASSDDKTAAAQTTLVKVSSQVYGPEESIAIKASQVAFWQNLRDDSKVTTAIKSKE